jgi:hypothetical protein
LRSSLAAKMIFYKLGILFIAKTCVLNVFSLVSQIWKWKASAHFSTTCLKSS